MSAWAFCKDDISKIENYDKAIGDKYQCWDCHHRTEIWWNCTSQELIDNECYYHRPAKELIFLTHGEHSKLHNKLGNYAKRTDAWCKTEEGRNYAKAHVSSLRWYNNGERNIRIKLTDTPPEGYVPGRTFGKRNRKNDYKEAE